MLRRGAPESEDFVSQYVARYRPGDAARYLDQVRARVSACEPGDGMSLRIGAKGFAGQDALLIEVNYGEGYTTAQELGRRAALRLCAGTPVC
jgi:hypothetical protein